MQRLKISILSLLTMLLLLIPVTAWGLYTPTVSNGHGVLMVRDIDKMGWLVGGEYGIMDNLAITADLGENNYSRAGVKVLLNPDFAFLGGILKSNLYMGVNVGINFSDNLSGIGELIICQLGNKMAADYEVGCKLNLVEQFDVRAGLIGEFSDSNASYNLMLGFGYSF